MKGEAPAPQWRGRTVFCLASGPSLTAADVELVRLTGHPTVVTNTTFRLAPWADALFAFDAKWWATKDPRTGLTHAQETARDFAGRRFCRSALGVNYGVESLHVSSWFRGSGNSGTCAVALALAAGAARIVLLGYDCSFAPDGRRHWHGDHPPGLGNCLSIARWPLQFRRVARDAKAASVRVTNASRHTALEQFERIPLEQVLLEVGEAPKVQVEIALEVRREVPEEVREVRADPAECQNGPKEGREQVKEGNSKASEVRVEVSAEVQEVRPQIVEVGAEVRSQV